MATVSLSPKRKFLSVDEAAAELGCTTGRIRQMLRAKELAGEKLNARAWAVDAKSVEKAAGKPQERGRPRVGSQE